MEKEEDISENECAYNQRNVPRVITIKGIL